MKEKEKGKGVSREAKQVSPQTDADGNGAPDVGETTLESTDVFRISRVGLFWEIEHASKGATFNVVSRQYCEQIRSANTSALTRWI